LGELEVQCSLFPNLHNKERYCRYFGGKGRIWIENTFIVFQILPVLATEREAWAAEISHPKDLELP